jgi:hypothetical protein
MKPKRPLPELHQKLGLKAGIDSNTNEQRSLRVGFRKRSLPSRVVQWVHHYFQKRRMTTTSIDHADLQIQAKRLLEGLATAPSSKDRLHICQLALIAYEHRCTRVHDDLVQAGAATVLTRCLQKAFYDAGKWEELSQLCQLLVLVFRCSDEQACQAFETIGAELMILVFSILVENSFQAVAWTTPCSFRELIGRFSDLSVSLNRTARKEQLIRLLQQILRGTDVSGLNVRVEAMQILAGVTRHPEGKTFAFESPGLVEDVLTTVQEPGAIDMIHLSAALFFCNLTWEARNKSQLVKKKDFIKVLLLLWEHGSITTRRTVMCTVRQLSSVMESRLSLSKFGDGALLLALAKTAKDHELCTESIETLLCLVEKSTARRIMQDPTLFVLLSSTALASGGSTSSIVAAAQSLKRLASYTTISDPCYQDLLDAMMNIAVSKDPNVRVWAAKAFIEQSRMSMNGFYIARMSQAMDVVTKLAQDKSPAVRSCATEALLNLAGDTANAKRLATDAELMKTFANNVASIDVCESSSRAKRNVIMTILTLANHKSAQRRVAKQIGLVASLSRYGVSQDADSDSELKKVALHGVILLAPLM